MHRLLITCFSAHWTVVFGLQALAKTSAVTDDTIAQSIVSAGLSLGCMLVSALFFWAALSAWGRASGALSDAGDVARIAVAAAAVMTSLSVAMNMMSGGDPAFAGPAMQVAALGATYLVVRFEEVAAERKPAEIDYSNIVARRLAAAAAHGSMLTRLSRRGPDALESDA